MDDHLIDAVRRRLDAAGLDQATTGLVVAACTGTPLDRAAEAAWPETAQLNANPATDTATATATAGVFLNGITVQGFRGIGPRRLLDLDPGPGLTLVVGRNGSGKSSFAEGLEMCLTGTSSRWSGRPKSWQETWRNLHAGDDALVAAELTGIDSQPRTLTHAWPAGETDVTAGTCTLDDGRTLDDLGWHTALTQYRPLLSFNELGGMFDGRPSDLYDAIALILGVEPLREAVEVLSKARLADAKPIKAVTDARKALLTQLRDSTDPRADPVIAAIEGKEATWDLPAALVAVEEDSTDPTSDLARLRALATVSTPHPMDATAAAKALRQAAAHLADAAATDAGRADRLADLLRAAIACVDHAATDPAATDPAATDPAADADQHPDPLTCPVCGSDHPLDAAWRARAVEESTALDAQAAAVRQADAVMAAARRAAGLLLPALPDSLGVADLVGLDATATAEAWQALLAAPDDPLALADHLEAAVTRLEDAATALRADAATALDRRQDDWRPLAASVARWVGDARAALAAKARAEAATKAEKWLAATASDIEAQRFEPIQDAVQEFWAKLRLQSNVQLKAVALKRSGRLRSLELDVTVDDSAASALGVMSQGELHSLALAVFLPRATTDASPFRFLILDDPVQAMDPARVDGLAAVLAEVARTRQVVVMTHDTRLPDAVRRMQIPATTFEVHRFPQSELSIKQVDDPVDRYLDDARAIARSVDLPPGVRAKLVAHMGRGAVESVSIELVRRRRLARGDDHGQVERTLDGRGVHDLLSLALFDAADEAATARVMPRLREWFAEYPAVFQDIKRGTHTGERTISDTDFVRHVEGLIKRIRTETPK